MKSKSALVVIFCAVFVFPQITLKNAFPKLSFSRPVDLQNADDNSNRIFIVEQGGIIKVFPNDSSVENIKVFLDISESVLSGGELGLLGLAFHPNYKNNGYFYVDYTTDNPRRTVVSRFKVSDSNPDSALESSELVLLEQSQPYSNHNGGRVIFGPDGFLYIGFGDGGSSGDPENRAQDLTTFLGKILRINVDSTQGSLNYSIPADNPYSGNTSGYKEEIYAYGFRNPWRFSFDISTSQLWCGDVGQDKWEEIDIVEKGGNYGWRIMEGNHCYFPANCNTAGLELPVWEYSHQLGCSVTGGAVYRGQQNPALFGKYIYGDYCSGSIWALSYTGINPDSPVNDFLLTSPSNILSFGTDENNELYVCGANGKIYKFVTSTSDTGEEKINPETFYVWQNYPNPFNPTTKIKYNVPERSRVKIKIVNVLGKLIGTIEDTVLSKGIYETSWNASGNPSGIYYIKVEAESLETGKQFDKTIKAVYLK